MNCFNSSSYGQKFPTHSRPFVQNSSGPSLAVTQFVFNASRQNHRLGIRNDLRDQVATEPIQDGPQTHKAQSHGDIGNIHAPGLIGTSYDDIAQAIQIAPIFRIRL